MAFKDNDIRQFPLKTSDLRTSVFYLKWLDLNERLRTDDFNRQDAESCRQAANKLINENCSDKEKKAALVRDIEAASNENILPPQYFEWLKNDERATFWLWAYLCNRSDYKISFSRANDLESAPRKDWYQKFKLSFSPMNHQERIECIIDFFDFEIIDTPLFKNPKKTKMERIKGEWKVIYNKPLPLKWLPDEEDSVLWAWNQLKEIQEVKRNFFSERGSNNVIYGLTTWFKPLNFTERNLALRAAIDLWSDAPDSKKLFLLNLNKAWNQQKLRKSRTDKKALNTYLKNETKRRLDLLAEHHGIRISDMLEKLINDAYIKNSQSNS